MARILLVGNAVLDLVFTVPHHPAEDEELRATDLRVRPGGNAANSARVLRALGHEAALAAVLGDAPAARPLEEGLRAAGVDLSRCRRVPGAAAVSAVLVHAGSGARTIVHHRAAPEYRLEDLAPHDLSPFRWAHFEARPGGETARMIRHARLFRPELLLSLEVEKPRPGVEECFPGVRLVLCSRGYAEAAGAPGPEAFLEGLHARVPRTLLAVAWGAAGAWGIEADGTLRHAPARPPEGGVVDTLGAGDAFNAGVVDALARGRPFAEALDAGCRLAGSSVGRPGLDAPQTGRQPAG